MPSLKLPRYFQRLTPAVLLVSAFLITVSNAAELTDLYQARVAAGQSQPQWQKQALQDVLVKLTGGEAVFAQPGIADALKNSGQFVVQFQQVQQDGQPQLLVTLDGQKITRLLQSLQIPVWGPRRPDVLLWLTERPVETPQFVISPEHPLRKALLQQAGRYGLSLQFPLYDETDSALVNEAASWGGDWALLQQASGRYQATEVYNLLFDQLTDASGLVQFRLTWQQLVDGGVQSKELLNADAMALAQQFCAELAAAQASRYAVRISASGDTAAGSLQLTFDGVSSLSDLVALRQLFSSMLTVRDHQLTQYQAGQAVLQLQLAASPDEFYRALSLVKELTPQPDAVAPEAVSADTGTGEPATEAPAAENPVTSPVQSSGELTDAEAAMEAALAGGQTDPAVAAESTLPLSAGQNSASAALVISSRYLFRRQ
ncbi:DUF2066 domain-containing protein [Rheinheimera texasensis]|uniref:DUF2066 domain-containing protein n=1 Tax=Rheinheimera texasensis TaxID=306205 RepID=UPI0004E18630|nr:DUF2066 domain-containing protein [Rheinheimera texasensis]